jgi:hypothetical protein
MFITIFTTAWHLPDSHRLTQFLRPPNVFSRTYSSPNKARSISTKTVTGFVTCICMFVSPPYKNGFYVPVCFNFQMCPFQSTNSNVTKQDRRPTRARAHKIYCFLSKILLTRIGQLRTDVAHFCTPYSQYQY